MAGRDSAFYPAPDPVQKVRNAPIGTQGAQPSRRDGGMDRIGVAVVAMWYATAAVPMPIQKPLNVVPLTLKYGQQPTRRDGGTDRVNGAVVRQQWPPDGEPRVTQYDLSQVSRRYIVPLTLKYGQQPPVIGPLAIEDWFITRASWPEDMEPRLPRLTIASTIAPLTLTIPDQPPPQVPLAVEDWAAISAWPPEKEPRLPQYTPGSSIATLTLPTGDQPRPNTLWKLASGDVVRSWPESQEPRLPRYTIASSVAPLTLTYGDQPPIVGPLSIEDLTAILTWPPEKEPRLPQYTPGSSIVTLTLPTGQQPRPRPGLTVSLLTALDWPSLDWPSQSEPNNASWNLPVVATSYVAPSRFPDAIVPSWAVTWSALSTEPSVAWIPVPAAAYIPRQPGVLYSVPLDSPPPGYARIAPLTLPTGQRSVVGTRLPAALWSSWPLTWTPPLPISLAPLTLVYGDAPAIRLQTIPDALGVSWVLSWQPPPLVMVAPLTLTYGQRPPVRLFIAPEVSQWMPIWASQSAAPVGAFFTNPPVVLSGPVSPQTLSGFWPPVVWSTQKAAPTAAWNVPLPARSGPHVQVPDSTRWVLRWQPPPLVTVAPLTLKYGQQPTPRLFIAPQVSVWILKWPSQSAAPVAAFFSNPPLPVFVSRITLNGGPVYVVTAFGDAAMQVHASGSPTYLAHTVDDSTYRVRRA